MKQAIRTIAGELCAYQCERCWSNNLRSIFNMKRIYSPVHSLLIWVFLDHLNAISSHPSVEMNSAQDNVHVTSTHKNIGFSFILLLLSSSQSSSLQYNDIN